jgi:hypothetical protein
LTSARGAAGAAVFDRSVAAGSMSKDHLFGFVAQSAPRRLLTAVISEGS